MSGRLSRRRLAAYVADSVISDASAVDSIKQLAAYLVESRRTKEVDLIVRDIDSELAARGIVNARITTAFSSSTTLQNLVASFVKKQTAAKKVIVESVVDSAVIGGVKVATAGRELDQTISSQLTSLRTRFKKA